MPRLCPHHGLEEWLIIHTFYNGLLYNTRLTIDATVGGALMDKPYTEANQLIKSMARNHYQWGSERANVEKTQTKGDMVEVNSLDQVNAKVEALTQKLENLTTALAATVAVVAQTCDLCGLQSHLALECPLLTGVPVEQANYVQGNPYSNTYNPGWKNHPNFSYKSNNALYAPGQAPATPPGYPKAIPNHPNNGPNTSNIPRKSNLEIMIEHFIASQSQTNKDVLNQNLHTNEQIKQ